MAKLTKQQQAEQNIVKPQKRQIEAGEREVVLASEEVQRMNAITMMAHGNETRRMVGELTIIIDALQNRLVSLNKEMLQLRNQVAILQGEFYKKGTVSYTGDDSD